MKKLLVILIIVIEVQTLKEVISRRKAVMMKIKKKQKSNIREKIMNMRVV